MTGATPSDNAQRREKPLRAFFAIWPDDDARTLLEALGHDAATRTGGRATAARNLHVTMAFVGDVASRDLGALSRIGAQAARSAPPFELVFDELAGVRRGGIAWLAPTSLPEPLVALHAAVCAGLANGGFAVERRDFRPHVTLARHGVRVLRRTHVTAIRWRIERLTLMASELAPGGSRYRELGGWTLAM